jgi:hypothetical protein
MKLIALLSLAVFALAAPQGGHGSAPSSNAPGLQACRSSCETQHDPATVFCVAVFPEVSCPWKEALLQFRMTDCYRSSPKVAKTKRSRKGKTGRDATAHAVVE